MHTTAGPTVSRAALVAVALAGALAGCAMARTPRADVATFVVVRHAEKADDGSRDPPLSPAGSTRAEALAAALADAPLAAVYATPLRRAQATAAPTARAHHQHVRAYPADTPAVTLAARLRREHPRGTVLVVGHGNTVPDIVAALCACAVDPIDETAYGDRYDVVVAPATPATLQLGRY